MMLCIGRQLFEHKEFARFDIPDCGWHNKGKVSRRDQKDIQHKKWLHSRGRRGSLKGESMGIWVGILRQS